VLLGFLIGLMLGAMGFDVPMIQVVAVLASVPVGAFCYYAYVHWVLTRQLGRYRIRLVAVSQS